jgi:hypothetical protein
VPWVEFHFPVINECLHEKTISSTLSMFSGQCQSVCSAIARIGSRHPGTMVNGILKRIGSLVRAL